MANTSTKKTPERRNTPDLYGTLRGDIELKIKQPSAKSYAALKANALKTDLPGTTITETRTRRLTWNPFVEPRDVSSQYGEDPQIEVEKEKCLISEYASLVADGGIHGRLHSERALFDERALCIAKFYHNRVWRWCYILAALANMVLCVFEEAVTMNTDDLGDHLNDGFDGWMTKNRKQVLVVTRWCAFLFLLFFVVDTGMLYRFQGRACFTKYVKFRITILALMMLNSIICLLWPTVPLFARILRPLILIERLRNVRKITGAIFLSLPKIVSVLLLLAMHVIFFGILGHIMFRGMSSPTSCKFAPLTHTPYELPSSTINNVTLPSKRVFCSVYYGICADYFSTIGASLLQMFVLLTTANFPDIMLPIFRCNKYYAIFFVLYILIGLYLLMSLVLAVIYSHFAARSKMKFKKFFDLRKQAFDLSHKLLCDSRGLGHVIINGEASIRTVKVYDTISIREFALLLKSMNPKMDEDIAKCIFWLVDEKYGDGSGEITSHTFSKGMRFAKMKTRMVSLFEEDDALFLRNPLVKTINWLKVNVRGKLQQLTALPWWDRFFDILILINSAVVLASVLHDEFHIDQKSLSTLEWLTTVMLFIFVTEVTVKILGMGLTKYIRQSWFNCIDIMTVAGGLAVYIGIQENTTEDNTVGLAFAILLFRLLRMLRLIQSIPEFDRIIKTIAAVLPAVFRFLTILLVIMYMYAIIGMEAFGRRMGEKAEKDNILFRFSSYNRLQYHALNFDSFYRAMVTLFSQLVVNNWPIVMEGAVAATNAWAHLYFISFYLICVLCVLNVLVAFLLDAYQSRELAIQKTAAFQFSSGELQRNVSSAVTLEGSHPIVQTLPKWHRSLIRAGERNGVNIRMWKLWLKSSTGEMYGGIYRDDDET